MVRRLFVMLLRRWLSLSLSLSLSHTHTHTHTHTHLSSTPPPFPSLRYLVNTPYGNVVVWSSLFFGQPMAIMLYVQAYLLQQKQQAET